jgi:DNA polymerase elongation subunit (family B)
MATLVLDIETIGESWLDFDLDTQNALTNWISQSTKTKAEYEKELLKVKEQLAFSPLTGSVVALGMYDIDRKLGAVYFVGDGNGESYTNGEFTFKERTEKELLEDFWEGARSYDVFVTFNGRAFDLPFLMHRSAILGVKPDITLLGQRYLNRQAIPYHVDLLDELTFYGAMKRQSLHMYCRAYGTPSPKGEGAGAEVSEMFQASRFRDLAAYNARDVIATTALYQKWKQCLAPASFINAIEL